MGTAAKYQTNSYSPHLEDLAAFGKVCGLDLRDKKKLQASIENLVHCFGEDGYADALGVAAFFAFISRVVDASGHTSKAIQFGTWVRKTGQPKAVLLTIVVGVFSLVAAGIWMMFF